MRAVVYDSYGPPDVLRLEDVERPVPKDDEMLVRVHATTVNRLDCHTREANRSNGAAISLISRLVSGVRRPRQRILGSELAGVVVAVGAAVSEFAVGDRVFGNTGLRFGAHAEFIAIGQNTRIAQMPAGMSFEDAAPVTDGALNALTCLKQADLREGRRILIYGASGAIGTAVIDYLHEDFKQNGQTYDVIFDAVGKETFGRCRGSLEPGGIYLPTDGLGNLVWALLPARSGDKRVIFQIPPRQTRQDVLLLKDLIEAGRFRAVIDRRYPLEDVVEATRYVETEQKVGNVVLTVSGADQGAGLS